VRGQNVALQIGPNDSASGAVAKVLPRAFLWQDAARVGKKLVLHQFLLLIVLFGWGLGIAVGSYALWSHAGTPGRQINGAPIWPTESALLREVNRKTLVVFAHPHCPCTRATLRELERLAAQTNGMLDLRVVFVQPPGTREDWALTELWQFARAIPGTTVSVDVDGVETRRFGARTSGEAILYDPEGKLVFQGGITPARGHEGDSVGRTAIVNWVTNHPAEARAPVFGCPLLDSSNLEANE
jgi:hypothetical protein